MARVPNATRDAFPEELQYVWDRAVVDPNASTTGAAAIFLAMGNNPHVLRGYLRLGNALWTNCGLDVATRELVILRAAYLQDSAYEWHQHVRIGRGAGLTDAQINALRDWQSSDLFSAAERALFGYTDAMAVSNHASGPAYDALAKEFPPATVVGVTVLIAFYFATAKFLSSMEVMTEDTFIGWDL